MNELPFPKELLKKHIAILGMTGSGKTSTAKRIVEEVADDKARVCVLDPIKSDWWGMISSASGKKPGLPFKILGGPKGHVPLHSSSGKVIGELVATGKLPLSIIDMADFEPGGLQKFFNAFADTLIKKMKGVLYLVIEEAHEFAPKERAGFGGENMSVHFAKKLATAGRSKGIRLVVATQRVQSLHNALLGSCPTQIIHQLTLPADQEPVIKFLKANVKDRDTRELIEDSLSDLKTGECWIVSTLNQNIERVKFPRIRTFDNSATPDDDAAMLEVKSAPVDQDELRAIIGDAVKEAEAKDPDKLLAQVRARDATIVTKDNEIRRLTQQLEAAKSAAPSAEDQQRWTTYGREAGYLEGYRDSTQQSVAALNRFSDDVIKTANVALAEAAKLDTIAKEMKRPEPVAAPPRRTVTAPSVAAKSPPPVRHVPSGSNGALPEGEAKILTVAIQFDGVDKDQLSVLTGYKRSSRNTYIQRLSAKGYVTVSGERVTPTDAGREALPHFEPLPTGAALQDFWMAKLPEGEKKILDYLLRSHPHRQSRESIQAATGYQRSSANTYIQRLGARRLVDTNSEGVAPSEQLF